MNFGFKIKPSPSPSASAKPGPRSSVLGAIAQFLLVSVVFGIAYTQDPIYYSPENQNTKYLQGLAQAGHGFLNEDWTANTLDPLPVFTWLVRFVYQYIHPEYGFYACYFIIFGLYVYSIVGVLNQVFRLQATRTRLLLFFALFLFFHTVHIEIFSFDLGWDLHAGVAMQYILGPVFQPCNFGVFLFLSIYAFLKHRPYWAAVSLAIAATFHPAYFPSVAALAAAYMAILVWETRDWKLPLGVGVATALLVLPVFSYMYFTFQDTSPELGQQATDIIVNQRIPHHSIPSVWLEDGEAYVQTVLVAIALFLIRNTRLFFVLLLPFLAAVSLTVLQMVVSSDTLAFMAPWRISAFLVPLGTSIIIGYLVTALVQRFPAMERQRAVLTARSSLVVILTLAIFGGINQYALLQKTDNTFAMLDFVRQTRQSGQVYLVHPDEEELRKFRLYTGAPIFINEKTHPYLDVEVIEWNRRSQMALEFYKTRRRGSCRMLRREFLPEGVTHVVLPQSNMENRCEDLREVYRDEHYGVFAADQL